LMIDLNFTCQCCGIACVPSKSCISAGLEIVTINKQAHVLCILCAQSQYLDRPSLSSKGGVLESNHGTLACYNNYSQGGIISISRDLHIARTYIAQNGGRSKNKSAFQAVDDTANDFDNKVGTIQSVLPLGIKSQHISGYVSTYKYASPELMSKEEEVFGRIRYIPNTSAFEEVLNYWLSTSYQPVINKLT